MQRLDVWDSSHLCVCCSCQFVVTDDQDYKAHITDPDTLVNWDCVQQVVSYPPSFDGEVFT